jgi:hypothetical protein
MTPNFLGPYWVQLNYTGNAPHTMTIPTKNWNPSGAVGTFDVWSGGTINALTMVQALVTKLLPLFDPGVSFNNYLVFRQLLPTDPVQPVASENFSGQIGTNTGGSWGAAVERIFIARSTAFGICKLSLLDAASEDNFNPIISPGVADQALITEWFADTNGWSARDNTQPNTFLKITCNLNQKLRKEYRFD